MSLQTKAIHRYRTFFPQDTLREISARTGIQITRVFRLLNGKTMKVGELEAFEKAIHHKMSENTHYHRFNELLEEASVLFTSEEMAKMTQYLERKMMNRRYSRSYIRPTLEKAIFA